MHFIFLCSHFQNCNFIGKDSIKKIKEEGVKRKLVLLKVDTSDIDPEGNETIRVGDKVSSDDIVRFKTLSAFAIEVEGHLLSHVDGN